MTAVVGNHNIKVKNDNYIFYHLFLPSILFTGLWGLPPPAPTTGSCANRLAAAPARKKARLFRSGNNPKNVKNPISRPWPIRKEP